MTNDKTNRWPIVFWTVLLIAVVWSYWETAVSLAGQWWQNPDYLHCFLVPVVAGYLLWHRRGLLPPGQHTGSSWGLLFLAVAVAMRWASEYFYFGTLDRLSLLPFAAGMALLWAGLDGLRWAWPSVLFLVFMIPVPGTLAGIASQPLQRIGTEVSTYLIQFLGIPAVSQGNVILLSDSSIGVVEACSGLKMMMLFAAICVAAVFLMRLRGIDKIAILLSAIPIAVVANVFRITLTAILHETVSHELADRVFHDLAGFLMMPLAMVLVLLETWLMEHLFLDPASIGPVPVSLGAGSREQGASSQ